MAAEKTVAKDEKPQVDEKEAVAVKPPPLTPVAEIKGNIQLIERAVSTLEPRFTLRVLRSITTLRKKLDASVLREAIDFSYPKRTSLSPSSTQREG